MTLHGLDRQIDMFRDAMAGDRMHHAWLFAGPPGVGKGTFARLAARRLLASASAAGVSDATFFVSDDHPTSRLIAARSHPDYRLVEREVWQKNVKDRLVPFAERKGDEEPARNIRICQIRWLEPVLSMAPAMSSKRVIVIDAADEMEAPATNALLKMLEEPPAGTVFLLVSHQPGRLLPTVRSRCRTMMFATLDPAAMTSFLTERLPRLDATERSRLIATAGGSPGKALASVEMNASGFEDALDQIANDGDPTNRVRSVLAQSLGLKSASARYEAFLDHVPGFIAMRARRAAGAELEACLNAWTKARALARIAGPQSLVAETVVFEMAGHVASLAAAGRGVKA